MSVAAADSNSAFFSRRWVAYLALCLVPVCLVPVCLVPIAGCSGSPGESESSAQREPASGPARARADGASTEGDRSATADDAAVESSSAVDVQLQEDLLRSVIDNFNRLDEFEPSEIFPQLRERLNQWMRQSRPASTWQRDPLPATLDAPLGSSPLAAYFLKNLETGLFTINDMVGLQEAVWLRDIAKNVRGDQLDDLSVAEQLFDWTVRNIQLMEDPPAGSPRIEHSPAEILLLGRGTARERAWIFLLLLRQQGLDGVMLAILRSDGPGSDSPAPREWLPALVTDTDLFLFDPWLGMPIPGPAGRRVATLADVVASDELLRNLDLDSKRPYPVKAEQLTGVVAYVEASPVCLSRRMETLEGRLTGDQRVILTARPQRLVERLAGRPHIGQVRCWPLPYEYWQARSALKPGQPPAAAAELMVFQVVEPLIKARTLQFKGVVDGERGAKHYYLKSRVPKEQLARLQPEARKIWETGKQDASYWLGLIAFEQKDYPVADDYFDRCTLKAAPDGPWTDGAHYNLGRTYEASGELAPAIDLYQSDRSPQMHGNRLRARRLKAQAAAPETAAEKQP